MTEYFVHSTNSKGTKHDRVEHLTHVARRVTEFAGKFGAGERGVRMTYINPVFRLSGSTTGAVDRGGISSKGAKTCVILC